MINQIIGVAVKQGEVYICLPKPNRHHHCMRYAVEVLGLKPPIGAKPLSQGFYDSRGVFLDRQTALIIARENGQLINQDAELDLFSEDLW